jgi:hypothetical protein
MAGLASNKKNEIDKKKPLWAHTFCKKMAD